jgi:hypothetical protein
MDDIERRVKGIIMRLNNENKEWTPRFSQMTRYSLLYNYGIFRKEETGWWQWFRGDYIDIAAFYKAVLEEFKLEPPVHGEAVYQRWFTVKDVADYVLQRLERKKKQGLKKKIEEEARNKERETRSKRAKDAWARKKARELEEKTRLAEEKRQERSRRMKEVWAKRKVKEQEEKNRREEQEGRERMNRETQESDSSSRRMATITGIDNVSILADIIIKLNEQIILAESLGRSAKVLRARVKVVERRMQELRNKRRANG